MRISPDRYVSYDQHGMSRTPEYRVWVGMKARCYHPKTKGYSRYGGRGIKVCDRWFRFKHFIEDMGPRPSKDHDLARKDPNGHYEPNNCEWQPHSVNMKNLRPRNANK